MYSRQKYRRHLIILSQLVEFLHHGNTEIRQVGTHHCPRTQRYNKKANSVLTAAENLVGFSTAQPSLFKRNTLEPIADLKLLIKDYTVIAKNALTMLINLTDDDEVIKTCIDDDVFLESLLKKVTV